MREEVIREKPTISEYDYSERVAMLVTTEMRQAAIDYWRRMNPDKPLIPVGEINGIIYAALGASEVVRAIVRHAMQADDEAHSLYASDGA